MNKKPLPLPVLFAEEIESLVCLWMLPPEYKQLISEGGTISDLIDAVGSDYAEAARLLLPGVIALKKFNDRSR
jgi:hypothetical protein